MSKGGVELIDLNNLSEKELINQDSNISLREPLLIDRNIGGESKYNRLYLLSYVCTIGLGSFMWGFGMLALTPNITTLEKLYHWNKTQETIGCVGGLVGALSTGLLAPYGRRKVLRLTCLIVIVGSIFNLFISLPCLIIGRIVIGYASGIFATLCPLFIIEVSPKEVRGSFGSFHQLLITVGILMCMSMGFGLPDPEELVRNPSNLTWIRGNWWRIIFAFPILPALILILLLTFCFPLETPRYYANNGDTLSCIRALAKIFTSNSGERVERERREYELMAREAGKDLTYRKLFSSKFLRMTLVGCSAMVLEQFSGINFVQLYSTSIFESVQGNHSSHSTTALMNLILGFIPFSFNLITIFSVEKWGRRPLLLWTTLLCGFIHIANGVFQDQNLKYAQVTMIYLYLADYYVALGPVLWLYIGEVMPDKALSLAVSANWISAIIITFALYPLAKLAIGFQGVFYFLGAFMFAGLIYEYIFILETKGKSISEVLAMFTKTVVPEELENDVSIN